MEYYGYLLETKSHVRLTEEELEIRDLLDKELDIDPLLHVIEPKSNLNVLNKKSLQQLVDSYEAEFEDIKNALPEGFYTIVNNILHRFTIFDPTWMQLMDKIGVTSLWQDHFNLVPETLKNPNARMNIYRSYYISYYMVPGILSWVVKTIIQIFVKINFDRYAIGKIDRTLENQLVYDHLINGINRVYEQNPTYKPASPEEFKQCSFFKKYAAEWREKTARQRVSRFSESLYFSLIIVCCKRFVPFGTLMGIPAQFLAGYCGLYTPFTSMSNITTEIEGNTITIGLTFTPYGFLLTNPKIYVFNSNHTLIRVDLPEIPKEYYTPKKAELVKIMKDVKKDHRKVTNSLKSQVGYLNDSV